MPPSFNSPNNLNAFQNQNPFPTPNPAPTPNQNPVQNQIPPQQPINIPPPRAKHTKLIVGIILAIIIIGGGVALAATGVVDIPIPFLSRAPYDKKHIVRDIAKGFSGIQSFSNVINVGLHAKPKDPDAEIVPNSPVQSADNLPENMDIVGQLSGSYQKVENDANIKLAATLDITAGDFDMNFAADTRKVGSDFYFIVTKFPSIIPIPGFESIRNKWVKVTQDDIAQSGSGIDIPNIFDMYKEYEENNKSSKEYVKIFLEVVDKDQLFSVKGNPVKEKIGDVNAYRYDLQIDYKNLPEVYKDLAKAFEAKYGAESPIKYSESDINDINSPESKKMIDYLNRNVSMSIWADSKGVPIKYSIRMRALPNTPTPSKTQINIDLSVMLTDINKTIKIEAPAEAISLDEAEALMTGKTKEQIKAEREDVPLKYAVNRIRPVAEMYYDSNKFSYSNLCKAGEINVSVNSELSDVAKSIIEKKQATTQKTAGVVCYSSKNAYVVAVPLVSPNKMWCVDSTGIAAEGSVDKTRFKCKPDQRDGSVLRPEEIPSVL